MKRKTQTKTDNKKSNNDDIKRYLGVPSEDFQHKVEAIGEQFLGLNDKLDSHTKSLDNINEKLDSHTEAFDKINHKLDSYTVRIKS